MFCKHTTPLPEKKRTDRRRTLFFCEAAGPVSKGGRQPSATPAFSLKTTGGTQPRERAMHEYSDYLRDEAAKYRELAAKDEDIYAKREFLELASICEEVANDMDDRRVSG
jgi:hypothetical protein